MGIKFFIVLIVAEDVYDSCNDAMKSPVPDLVRSQGLYLFEVNYYWPYLIFKTLKLNVHV